MSKHQESSDAEEVHGILNTLLVPMDPPNRSQWRKLELAMKFINISKQSVENSRKLNMGLKEVKPRKRVVTVSQYPALTQKQHADKVHLQNLAPKCSKQDVKEKVSTKKDATSEKNRVTMKLDPIDTRRSLVPIMKKQNSWDKLKNCAVQIMVLPFEFDAQRS